MSNLRLRVAVPNPDVPNQVPVCWDGPGGSIGPIEGISNLVEHWDVEDDRRPQSSIIRAIE